MLHFSKFLPLYLATNVLALLPEAHIARLDEYNQAPGPLSLPNLLEVQSVGDLENAWSLQGDMELEAGRLVVKKNLGSIWAHDTLENSKDEWTIEVVFRNSEQVEVDDHLFYDTNGFAFWLLDAYGLMLDDFLNFGGPKKYDGFQFLINNKDRRGLKIFANDGEHEAVNVKDAALGGCDINYLDSMIPFTLRVSYSAKTNWFKVQIDNNLCFKTDKLTFGNIPRELRFGVSASTNEVSKEYWEVLKLNVYPFLTENAIDDHGIITGGSIKHITVTDKQAPTHTPQITRQSLMEKTRQFQESLQRESAEKNGGNTQEGTANFDSSLTDISTKLAILEEMLNKVDMSKLENLESVLDDVKKIQMQQVEVLDEMKNRYNKFESLLATLFKEVSNTMSLLHERVVNEIRDHLKELSILNTKVELISTNHKSFHDQYKSVTESLTPNDSSEFFNVVLKWVLLPLVVGIAVLATFVYRLRKDIKHLKLL
ncbi:CIC11C00000004971 [Sungouiella intermedia]|uniref:CIC11C00000004971 n=1 Tax=Sungouiella intermedia TaxID=45354 RepID=A0A1L0DFN3_9ASCO|nr:CIC11C00000004971 [[Candida] intermedia]